MLTVTLPTDLGVVFIVTRSSEEAAPHRRPLLPGNWTGDQWVDTDLSGEDAIVREAAAAAWTPDVVDAYKAAMYIAPQITPTRWQVTRRTIVKRLAAAGKLDAAEAALAAADAETRWLWNTVDEVGGMFNDDTQAHALLAAIGADAAVILAVEDLTEAPRPSPQMD